MGPPVGLTEEHVRSIHAFVGEQSGGVHDGSPTVVVAWQPDAEELKQLNEGAFVYLTVIGGLPPHFVTTSFPFPLNENRSETA